jgi:hypothetical protein
MLLHEIRLFVISLTGKEEFILKFMKRNSEKLVEDLVNAGAVVHTEALFVEQI